MACRWAAGCWRPACCFAHPDEQERAERLVRYWHAAAADSAAATQAPAPLPYTHILEEKIDLLIGIMTEACGGSVTREFKTGIPQPDVVTKTSDQRAVPMSSNVDHASSIPSAENAYDESISHGFLPLSSTEDKDDFPSSSDEFIGTPATDD